MLYFTLVIIFLQKCGNNKIIGENKQNNFYYKLTIVKIMKIIVKYILGKKYFFICLL